jgi:hypothetical protein
MASSAKNPLVYALGFVGELIMWMCLNLAAAVATIYYLHPEEVEHITGFTLLCSCFVVSCQWPLDLILQQIQSRS